jgi:uncharacterized protein with HEPN domain
MRSERERLLDILEAIARIEKYASRGKTAFLKDELIQNWMVSQIAIIGEACRALPAEFQARCAQCTLGGYHHDAEHLDSSLFRHR